MNAENVDPNGPSNSPRRSGDDKPVGNLAGFFKFARYDLLSGFLVFLIALPLCLGIALACGYPAIAGVFTAIVGALVTTFISNSELTIKGPAAGLIMIAIGCVESFGGDGAVGGFTQQDMTAYRMALAVGVVAAILQILFGLARAGILGEFFPLSAVHGMLASIGVIIMVKQLPVALGVEGRGEPLEMIREIPHYLREMNPEIALIGLVGLVIMFGWPWVQKLHGLLKAVPAPMVVLLATVPMGIYFDLLHPHTYTFHGHTYQVGESYLVNMPDRVFGMFDFITTPDFAAFSGPHLPNALKWVFMFFAIGSLESMLSAKAVDIIDPWKRKTNLDRDIVAVGVGNLCAAAIGGLPMISEIVRSKANIDNGARTRFANMWHGIFLLLCVALIPTLLHRIPLAALASMLIYTGFRLTHPAEFLHVYRIGKEQLLIFVATLLGVLVTGDLLIGILAGIGVKLVVHLINGVPIISLFKSYMDVEMRDEKTAFVRARYSAVFTNWILFRRKLVQLGLQERNDVILDLSACKLVDHSVMEKLKELEEDFRAEGLRLDIRGLEGHRQLSDHELAARKQATIRLRRVTVVLSDDLEKAVTSRFAELGATGYTATACHGAGRRELARAGGPAAREGTAERFGPESGPENGPESGPENGQVRIEVIAPQDVAENILEYLRQEVVPEHRVTACSEFVEVLKQEQYRNADRR